MFEGENIYLLTDLAYVLLTYLLVSEHELELELRKWVRIG